MGEAKRKRAWRDDRHIVPLIAKASCAGPGTGEDHEICERANSILRVLAMHLSCLDDEKLRREMIDGVVPILSRLVVCCQHAMSTAELAEQESGLPMHTLAEDLRKA